MRRERDKQRIKRHRQRPRVEERNQEMGFYYAFIHYMWCNERTPSKSCFTLLLDGNSAVYF